MKSWSVAKKAIGITVAAAVMFSTMFGFNPTSVSAATATTVTVDCSSNGGTVNPLTWGVGCPGSELNWIGNATVKQRISDAKIKLVRVGPIQDCLNNGVDPYPSANNWNFTRMDAILNTIFDAGAEPLFIVCGFPAGVPHTLDGNRNVTSVDWNAYKTFVEGIVQRYNVTKALGSTRTIKYWEMWNEIDVEYDGKLTRDQYKTFVQTVAPAMKAKDSGIKIIAPVHSSSDDHFSNGTNSLVSYAAKNLENECDILSWHNYGPGQDIGYTDTDRMNWIKPSYQDDIVKVKAGGPANEFKGPSGKLYGAAITEYNMSGCSWDATFNAKYHSEWNATYVASSIISAMRANADLFSYFIMAQAGTNLLGILNNSDWSVYKPYYTFYMFGNYFGNQKVNSSGGATNLDYIASKNTTTGKYYVIVSNKETNGTTHDVTVNLNNISNSSGTVVVRKIDASTIPTTSTQINYSGSQFTYTVPPYTVVSFEITPGTGGVTPTPTPTPTPGGTNIALNKTATASQYVTGEGPDKAVDGSVINNSKWCSTATGDKWLMLDLGQAYSINRWVVKHAGAGGEATNWNTMDFKLQKSSNGTSWTDVDSVTGNTANITDRSITAFTERYVRLYITKPTADAETASRIYEFELYGPSATPTPTPTPSGSGLKGEYYDNMDFTNLKLTRTDSTVNFDWGTGSPDASIGADTFSVRWTGKVKPTYSQTYTFYELSDDRGRLWVNNQLIIDQWNDGGGTEYSGTISLTAGQWYDIKYEFGDNGADANAKLQWSSSSQAKQVIPAAALQPAP